MFPSQTTQRTHTRGYNLTPIRLRANIALTAFCHFRLYTNFFKRLVDRDRVGIRSRFAERCSDNNITL